ncbi:uncharacterized protein BX663DRAFT_569157 [Cokeromyces recurvatus]|uniref:uncharacterized protein n=1 Tax=Cokeromyces recurvatus TaxID=90255 RepID=UPI00221E696E|nr:uncharacterized protein BX663DRAFT_569157 [Cokeromyces recurvatus]KAI7903081.1 hypothetical protein BX663DRAFT_569157 [Cokeromyces recurvatus]
MPTLKTPLSDTLTTSMDTKIELLDENSFWTNDPPNKQINAILSVSSNSSTTQLHAHHHRPSLTDSQYNSNDPFLFDHSHLKPGDKASLLSYPKTIDMYRENVKKTNDMDIQCDFAIFLVEAAKRLQPSMQTSLSSSTVSSYNSNESTLDSRDNKIPPDEKEINLQRQTYILEAKRLLKQIAMRRHSESQYYLANMYASGILKATNSHEKAFAFFVQSAKRKHPDAVYRTAKCYEEGLGTKKDKSKAVQYYRKAAALNHPGAMYRLGLAEMKGELNLTRSTRNGHKWLKRSAEAATVQYPHALHELALLHEKGVDSIVFYDPDYAVSLYHEAAALGYAPSAYRLGECYKLGKLNCNLHPQLSIQYYRIAAEQNHPEACLALAAWYLSDLSTLLTISAEQAYTWAMSAAQQGLPKAEYIIGYLFEMGIGTVKDQNVAMAWYRKAADHGEVRAIQKLHMYSPSLVNNDKNHRPLSISLSISSFMTKKSLTKPKDNNLNRSISTFALTNERTGLDLSTHTKKQQQDSDITFFQKAAIFLKSPLPKNANDSDTSISTLKE